MARMQKPAWAIEVGGHNYGLNLFWVGVKTVRSDRDEPFSTIEDDSDARVALELGMVAPDPLDLLIAEEEGLELEKQAELRAGSATLGELMGDAIDYFLDPCDRDYFDEDFDAIDDMAIFLGMAPVEPEDIGVSGEMATRRARYDRREYRCDVVRAKESNHREKVCRLPKRKTLTIRRMVAA